MTVHAAVCENCGRSFGYDAPPNPTVTPDYCCESCKRVAEYEG